MPGVGASGPLPSAIRTPELPAPSSCTTMIGWLRSIRSAPCGRRRTRLRRSLPFPTTSSRPTKRDSWPPAIRSASCTSPDPKSICLGHESIRAAVYEKARENLAALREHGAARASTTTPALYFYRLRMGGHEQTGIAGCFSVDEYESDLIKKHERTRRDKEDDRTRHIVQLRAQTGVVFLTYRADRTIDSVARQVSRGRAVLRFYRSGRRAPHDLARRPRPDAPPRGGVRRHSRALHR